MLHENVILKQIQCFCCVCASAFDKHLGVFRMKGGMRDRVGFLTQNKKKAPDWSTSCSIEGLSFFLFTPALQRNAGGGREKETGGEKKL